MLECLTLKLTQFADAKVAELADALVLGASGATRGSSSLPFRTKIKNSTVKSTENSAFLCSQIQAVMIVPLQKSIEHLILFTNSHKCPVPLAHFSGKCITRL